jgi:hypothetical protein
MHNTGTIKKLVIDGVTYDVSADAKASFNPSQYETEGQATTGETMFKMTKRVQTMEGVETMMTPKQLESLRAKVDSLADLTLAITLIDGTTYRGSGRVKLDKWESDTGKATIDLIPRAPWTPFLAD